MENKLKNIGLAICLSLMLVAFVTKNKHEVIFTKLAPTPIGPYSQAIKSGGTVYVSGQIGIDPTGKLDSTSIEVECKQVMENIKAVVEASGLKMSNIVKATIYTTDLKKFSQINDVYKTYFINDPPARETVQVVALPKGAHVEISAIAEN